MITGFLIWTIDLRKRKIQNLSGTCPSLQTSALLPNSLLNELLQIQQTVRIHFRKCEEFTGSRWKRLKWFSSFFEKSWVLLTAEMLARTLKPQRTQHNHIRTSTKRGDSTIHTSQLKDVWILVLSHCINPKYLRNDQRILETFRLKCAHLTFLLVS